MPLPNWLKGLFSGGIQSTVSAIADLSEKHLGKKELKLEIERMLHVRDMALMENLNAELGAKERILVAELQQGDSYTKRARPTVIYVGLIAMILQGLNAVAFTLPTEFWYAWSALVGTYAIGRSAEKVKANGNGLTRLITGSPEVPTMLK